MSEPVIEMLWEPRDAGVVLRERFGFASAAAVGAWACEVVATDYGIAASGCQRVVMSAGNALAWVDAEVGPLVVKWSIASEQFARLAGVAELTAWLAERGHPVSAPMASRDGRLQVERDGVSVNVQRVARGDHLDAGNLAMVEQAGLVLARLHADLRLRTDTAQAFAVQAPARGLRGRIEGWMDADLGHLPEGSTGVLRELVARVPGEPGRVQLVHGDYRAANILTDRERPTCVLDFEEVRLDHPVNELARSAVLLGTLFRGWGPVPTPVHAALRRGYEQVRPLDPVEAAWWQPLVLWNSLLMVPRGDDPTGWAAAAGGLVAEPA